MSLMPALRPHPIQYKLWTAPTRFAVAPCGRRSGKTELAKRHVIRCALYGTAFPDARFFCAAPSRMQAKRIYWEDLIKYSPDVFVTNINWTELFIQYVNGSRVYVLGLDKPQTIEGSPWDGGVLDEYADMKEEAWRLHVRPALTDRQGWCWLIGVPEGRNHYYDTYKRALSGESAEWGAFHWISADILSAHEIEQIKLETDEISYRQEYEGSFENFTGVAYYNFSDKTHYTSIERDKNRPLILCFDFNTAPGVAVICQEFTQQEVHGIIAPGCSPTVTVAVGEVHIERNSNTEIVCNRIIKDYSDHQSIIQIYGDATGGAKGSAKIKGSDWDIVKSTLTPAFGNRIRMHVPNANPKERSRVNSVNSRLKTVSGFRGLMVNAKRCPHLVKDFEGVQTVVGGSGEIDKKKNKQLTHLSDAIGYYIHKEYPISKGRAVRTLGGF